MAAFFLVIILGSCGDNAGDSVSPTIEFLGMSNDTMSQSSLNIDSTLIRIRFEDPDGDIGGTETRNLIIIDTRTGEEYDSFSLPDLPESKDGVEGEITIRLFTTCCIFPENIPPCEAPPQYPENELILNIFMLDDAGNRSNEISTTPVVLLCN